MTGAVIGRDYYPGTRTEIIHEDPPAPPPAPPDAADIFSRPCTGYQINGKPFECYTIGTLARALDERSPVTIRQWERLGVLPRTNFRSPKQQGEGKARLYTRAQIEGIVAIAREEGIYPRASKIPIRFTNFTARVVELFRTTDALYRSKP